MNKVSAKRRKKVKLAHNSTFSAGATRKQLARRKGVKKSNPRRRASEFKRCYGSKARVAFVQSLPCAACGIIGYSENAHVGGNGGMGRKGPYTEIAPLCGVSPSRIRDGDLYPGCHFFLEVHREHFKKRYDVMRFAAETERRWQAFKGEKK